MADFQKSDHQPEAEVLAEATEKRRGPRYPFDMGEVLVVTRQGRSQTATVRGVSASGMGLFFDEIPSLTIGQEAAVTYNGVPKTGIVRHVTPFEQDNYLVGLEWIKRDLPAPEPNSTDGQVSVTSTFDAQRAQMMLTQLRELTTRVGSGVGEYTAYVEELSNELAGITACREDSAEDVILRMVTDMLKANTQLQGRLKSAAQEIEEKARRIDGHLADALMDPLTGIANRRAYDQELDRRFAQWRRQQVRFSLLMVDIDHFKRLNDQHGHQAGDKVLGDVANVLHQTLREMDLATRYGGDEFAGILPNTSLADAKRAAERVHAAIEASRFRFEGAELRVTASVGVAEVISDDELDSLVKRADAALYAAKDGGRNRGYFHDGTACHPIELTGGARRADAGPKSKPQVTPKRRVSSE